MSSRTQNSTALQAAEALLQEYLPKLKALPAAEVTRVVCGGCGDFKVIVNQPCAEHDAWKAAEYAPEAEFIAKLPKILRRMTGPKGSLPRTIVTDRGPGFFSKNGYFIKEYKNALKKSLEGITEEYQATDKGDLDIKEIQKKAGGV